MWKILKSWLAGVTGKNKQAKTACHKKEMNKKSRAWSVKKGQSYLQKIFYIQGS